MDQIWPFGILEMVDAQLFARSDAGTPPPARSAGHVLCLPHRVPRLINHTIGCVKGYIDRPGQQQGGVRGREIAGSRAPIKQTVLPGLTCFRCVPKPTPHWFIDPMVG